MFNHSKIIDLLMPSLAPFAVPPHLCLGEWAKYDRKGGEIRLVKPLLPFFATNHCVH